MPDASPSPVQPSPADSGSVTATDGPRIDVVVDRDPDNDTTVEVYLDGLLTEAHVHVVDPGRSGADHEWMQNMTALGAAVPKAVGDSVRGFAEGYHPPGPCCAGEAQELPF